MAAAQMVGGPADGLEIDVHADALRVTIPVFHFMEPVYAVVYQRRTDGDTIHMDYIGRDDPIQRGIRAAVLKVMLGLVEDAK